MRTYESIIIFHPEAPEEARRDVQEKLRGIVERTGGEIQTVDDWGKRKLAYAVRKQRYGQTTRIQFKGAPTVIGELDQVLRHAEQVIKYMTAVLGDKLLQQQAAEAPAQVPAALDSAENGRRGRR